MKRKWTAENIKFLVDNYSIMNNINISQATGFNVDSIRHKAKSLKLKKFGRRNDITYTNKFLNGSLESLYWIGFILADGHIDKKYRLTISLSINDKPHLEKLARYLNVKIKELPYRDGTLSTNSTFLQLRASGKKYLESVSKMFDIKSNKTYNPPNFSSYSHLNEKQWLALIIGFIDGDGCIQRQVRIKGNTALNIHINVHEHWFNNLCYINNIIKIYSNIRTRMAPRIVNNMAKLDISNNQIICKLKAFVIDNSLPYLERKWDKIDHNMTHTRTYN